uniref:Reverse transcriptase/retrotransposon-derived protein RNase H-like domain-containing protein n=1 Tax=Gadus morhua TaxID=8049 RepID=A0A8C5B6F0_GADMO
LKGSTNHLTQPNHVVFLGHVVSRHGLQPDPQNTDKVRTWPTPKTQTEVRAFVGLCSCYSLFAMGFSWRAAPLHLLTCKDIPFQWTTECDEAFEYLKGVLSSAPIVTMPDFYVPFKVYTDAFMDAVGAVVAQDREGLERVVVYASQTLAPTEKCLSTFDRDMGTGKANLLLALNVKDIQQWCEHCIPCLTRRAPAPKHRAPMGGSQATLQFKDFISYG